MSPRIAVVLLLAVLAGLAALPTLAQDPPPAPEPELEPPPVPAEEDPPTKAPEEAPEVDVEAPTIRWERTIYVPFRELRAVFEKEGDGVYVPRSEFEKLWRKAMDRPDRPDRPAAASLVTKAQYTGRVEGDLAVVEAEIDVETFGEGWTEVPLGLSAVALGEARLDGEPATLTLVKGAHRLLVPSKGKHRLSLTFVTAVAKGKDGRVVSFGCPTVPVARLDFTVPGAGVKVTVEPNLATTRAEEGDKATRVRAYVGGAGKITMRWKPKPVDLVEGPALLLAQSQLVATFGEGVLRTDARIDYRILRAPVSAFRVRIPEGVRVLFVDGKDLRDWRIEGSGDARRLVVSLHTPARDAYALSITLETAAGDLTAPVAVPEIVEEGVLRAQGTIVVRGPADHQIRPGDIAGVFRLNPSQLPKALASPRNVLAYRFPGHPWTVPLLVERILPRVTVVERTLVQLSERNVRLQAMFDVAVARVGIFQLELTVPGDLTVLDVGPPALVEDWRLEGEGEGRRLLVDLKERKEGAFTLVVVGEKALEVGATDVETALPLLEPQSVDRLSGTIGVQAIESFELKTGTLTGLAPLDPARASARLGVAPPPGRNARAQGGGQAGRAIPSLVMAFRYQGTGRAGTLIVGRKRSEASVRTVARVAVEENRALVRGDLDFSVRYAGVDTFRFSLPASVPEDDVIVTASGLKEKSTRLVEDGTRREWTVTTQSKVLGMLRIRLEYHLSFEALQAGGRVAVVVPDLKVEDVVRTQHWYAVTKDPVLEIDSEELKVEVVDPRELPEEARKEGAFLAFRTLEQPHRLTLNVTRHEYVPLLETVVNHLHVTTKLSREGVALHTATLSLKTSGRQYLAVVMPEGAKIQEVEVDGRKERPRTDEDGQHTLIPLGSRGAGEKVSRVRIVYRQDDVDPSGFPSKSFLLRAPSFGGEDGEVPVSGTSWVLWLPPDVLVTGTDGNMSRLRPYRSWVRSALGRFLPHLRPVSERALSGRDVTEVVPDGVVRSGVRVQFSRAEGDAEVGVSYASPALYALLQVLFLLVAAGAGLLLPRRGFDKTTVCLALVLVPVVLLAFAGPGFARILNGVLLGGVLAGAVWIVAALAAAARAWQESRPVPAPAPVGPAPVDPVEVEEVDDDEAEEAKPEKAKPEKEEPKKAKPKPKPKKKEKGEEA